MGHWPQSRLGQSKRRCLQKAENKESRQRATRAQSLSAQRARRFPLRPFLRAQVSALQERYNKENTEESEKHSTQTACLFTPQTKHPPSLPSRRTRQAEATSGGGTTRELMQSHMRRGAFGAQRIKTSSHTHTCVRVQPNEIPGRRNPEGACLPACLLPTACDYNGLDCFDPLAHVGSGGKRRCSSSGNRAPGQILDVGVNTTKEIPLPLYRSQVRCRHQDTTKRNQARVSSSGLLFKRFL